MRREKCAGLFYYFQAPRSNGVGRRHFWRYIDARSHEIGENRFEIAGIIACLPDEPRYIAAHDVFALQDRVIEHILSAERQAEARAAAPTAVDPIQQTVAEELKDAIRRRSVDREAAKASLGFLAQPMGPSLHVRLRDVFRRWSDSHDDAAFVAEVSALADEFRKDRPAMSHAKRLERSDLNLICFEYVSA